MTGADKAPAVVDKAPATIPAPMRLPHAVTRLSAAVLAAVGCSTGDLTDIEAGRSIAMCEQAITHLRQLRDKIRSMPRKGA